MSLLCLFAALYAVGPVSFAIYVVARAYGLTYRLLEKGRLADDIGEVQEAWLEKLKAEGDAPPLFLLLSPAWPLYYRRLEVVFADCEDALERGTRPFTLHNPRNQEGDE